MIDDRLRSRLEQLNREPLPPHTISVQPAQPASAQRVLASPPPPRAVEPISGLMQRGTAVTNQAGEHWRIVLPLEELWPGGEDLTARRHAQLAGLSLPEIPSPAQKELADFVRAFPQNLLLVDLETCGLAGSSLFLIGLLRFVEQRLAIELLLARSYAEEQAVLATYWQAIGPDTVVVTFNGKSFDWPMLVDRSARYLMFGGSSQPVPPHVDLLHHARRRWRRQLPNCRLQTLERHICGRGRTGDIPGSQIPAAYQRFVRTGKDHEMNAILLHNAIDLVTLLDIGLRLAG